MASPGGQSCSPLEGSASECVAEGNKSLSNSFSIANILSENVGPQRRPSSDSSPPLDPSPHYHHHQHPPPPHLSLPLPFPSHTTHPTPPATSNVAVCCSGAGTTPVRALSLSEAASLMLSPPFDSPSAVAAHPPPLLHQTPKRYIAFSHHRNPFLSSPLNIFLQSTATDAASPTAITTSSTANHLNRLEPASSSTNQLQYCALPIAGGGGSAAPPTTNSASAVHVLVGGCGGSSVTCTRCGWGGSSTCTACTGDIGRACNTQQGGMGGGGGERGTSFVPSSSSSSSTSCSASQVDSSNLGMLSTVALLHNKLSSGTTSEASHLHRHHHCSGGSVIATTGGIGSSASLLGGRIEHMRIDSVCKDQSSMAEGTHMERKTSTTPCILKRDRRLRLRSLTSVSDASVAHSNTGLLSPNGSSCCKTPSRPLAPDQTFSPSIFLSHPSVVLFDRSATSPNTSEALVASPSETECSSSSESRGTSSTCFVTSTPIRRDKENLHYVSPPVSSEHYGGKRPTSWRDFGELSSSSETEMPRKRARISRRKSRARTKLSPLLENACSPISKADHLPMYPSTLTTNSLIPPPPPPPPPQASSMQSRQLRFDLPSISMEDTATTSASSSSGAQLFRQPLPPKGVDKNLAAVLAPMQAASSDGNLQCHSPPPSSHIPLPLSSSSSPLPPLTLLGDSAHCSSSHQHHHHHNYHHHLASSPGPHAHKGGVGGVGGWGHSSPVTAQWSSTGQIQSVPPWFIFSTKKPELEKRMRLTEAINRSLMETPSQNPKLPVGWTKLACGGTQDQKTLTEKARCFVQCRPRQLHFNNN